MNTLEKDLLNDFNYLIDNYDDVINKIQLSPKIIKDLVVPETFLTKHLASTLFKSDRMHQLALISKKHHLNMDFFEICLGTSAFHFFLHFPNPNVKQIKISLKYNGRLIRHIDNPDAESCKIAINFCGKTIGYIDPHLWTEELIETAIMNNPYSMVIIMAKIPIYKKKVMDKKNIIHAKGLKNKLVSFLANSLKITKLKHDNHYIIETGKFLQEQNFNFSQLAMIENSCPSLSPYIQKNKNYSWAQGILDTINKENK